MMERLAMEAIAERLASVEGLYFPGAIRQETPFDDSRRKSVLLDLLLRDASIFLERYGSVLTSEELRQFEPLCTDYEVGWHLKRLRKPVDLPQVISATVKNRRRAYMEKLLLEGEYFSEEAMREREPYLHHEYVGRWQDPSGRMMSRPGEKWSETLLRRCDEVVLVGKIRGEQMRRGVDRKEWVGVNEEEEEEEEEEGEEEEEEEEEEENGEKMEEDKSKETNLLPDKDPAAQPSMECSTTGQAISEEELQDHLEQFTQIMQQKFLAGEDTEHLDYLKIDNDERLDDHWTREANYDAEEKYFEED
ncbi:Coiled-coil domain-containing protein 97 [Rhynchospora pubera]|uniref:Coiled-coil domain-containing protein 97 n=1 Tax=Rhynchospora pubera TaxID=906938 RepID=A0AAV8E7Y7_9POAL|nr:Coiled-coil domain-containing protein 97 [Rhynchospora pubera]